MSKMMDELFSKYRGDGKTTMMLAAFFNMQAGAAYALKWSRPVRLLKRYKDEGIVVLKHTTALVRAGVDYDNINDVQEKREAGDLPAVSAGLPWGEWLIFPLVIRHKGEDYLRFYPAKFGAEPVVIFTGEDGKHTITRERVRELALASEFAERDESAECFTLRLSTLAGLRRES